MEKILKGVVRFHETVTEEVRPMFARLVKEGQSPRALFITCADSRIVPNQITTTDPGDLFLLRNIGNLVPPYSVVSAVQAGSSVAAAVEYALEHLRIPNIIVCGHSDCGAMNAVRNFKKLPEGSHLRAWLSYAEQALSRLLEGKVLDDTLSTQNQLAQLNVLQQIAHLREYPIVQQKLQEGKVDLYAMFLDILNAEVQIYHPGRNRFVRVDPSVVEELAYLKRVFAAVPGVRLNLPDTEAFQHQIGHSNGSQAVVAESKKAAAASSGKK